MRLRTVVTILIAVLASGTAHASDAAREATGRHLAAGTLAAGDLELSQLIARDTRDQEAKFGLGLVRLAKAAANLAQAYYRYGARSPDIAFLRINPAGLPGNPNPQPLRYEDFRQTLQTFATDLDEADAALAAVDDPAVKIPLDVARIAFDVDADGRITGGEGQFIASFLQGRRPPGRQAAPATPLDTTVAFDLGDAYWFRGYTHLLMAAAEFLLAYDFHEVFDGTFHQLFAKVASPMAQALTSPGQPSLLGVPNDSLADAIAFIHLIHWPVAEAQRLRSVRDHLKTVVALSRKTWDAILAETDNDREWLPGPSQMSALVPMAVTAQQISDWRKFLDETDAVLDGTRLLPHWRFQNGINLRRVFEAPTTFDLVLWVTGQAAVPYLEYGPVSDGRVWQQLNRSFGAAATAISSGSTRPSMRR